MNSRLSNTIMLATKIIYFEEGFIMAREIYVFHGNVFGNLLPKKMKKSWGSEKFRIPNPGNEKSR